MDEATALASLERRLLTGLRVEGEWNGTPHLIWTRGCFADGYGSIWDNRVGNMRKVHRVLFEVWTGEPMPEDLVTDHLCRVHPCAALNHIEPVTTAVNIERGEVAQWQRDKTHCPAGHPYDEENTRVVVNDRGTSRVCRACDRIRARRTPSG